VAGRAWRGAELSGLAVRARHRDGGAQFDGASPCGEGLLVLLEAAGPLEVPAGEVARELNNLLTVILGNADLAALDPTISPVLRTCLEQIQQATTRAAKVLKARG
jgi:hypothetical protein